MRERTPGLWCYQENADKYTHIVRGPGNRFICQLSQTTDGESESNARFIASGPAMEAELTRLRLEVERHKQEALSFHSIGCDLSEENDRLRASNAELLAACQSLCTWIEVTDQDSSVYVADAMVKVRAAVAHAQGSAALTPGESPS